MLPNRTLLWCAARYKRLTKNRIVRSDTLHGKVNPHDRDQHRFSPPAEEQTIDPTAAPEQPRRTWDQRR